MNVLINVNIVLIILRISVIIQKSNSNTAQSQTLALPYCLQKSTSQARIQKRVHKYKEQLKMSERMEWEHKQKYMSMQYGKNHCSSMLQNIQIDFGVIMVPVCIEMLILLHESWSRRIQIVTTIIDQLCCDSISNDQFALKMCKFMYSIGVQFGDPRPLVIQSMQTQIQRLCDNKPMQLCFFAPYILHQVSQTWIIRKKALREAGEALSRSIIVSCCSFDTDNSLLYAMFDLVKSKQSVIRSKAAGLIQLLLQRIKISFLEV